MKIDMTKIKDKKTREDLQQPVSSSDCIVKKLKSLLELQPRIEKEKEHLYCFGLDIQNNIKFIDLVSTGTMKANLIHPREVFRTAISESVDSVIVGSNHPSGGVYPSDEEVYFTKKLISAGRVVGIELKDHVIVSEKDCYTFKYQGPHCSLWRSQDLESTEEKSNECVTKMDVVDRVMVLLKKDMHLVADSSAGSSWVWDVKDSEQYDLITQMTEVLGHIDLSSDEVSENVCIDKLVEQLWAWAKDIDDYRKIYQTCLQLLTGCLDRKDWMDKATEQIKHLINQGNNHEIDEWAERLFQIMKSAKAA